MAADPTARIRSADFGTGDTLIVRYRGGRTDTLRLEPAPRPGAEPLQLRWSDAAGVVVDGADPPGQRFSFSDRAAAFRLIAALRAYGAVTVRVAERGRPNPAQRAVAVRGAGGRPTDRGTDAPPADDLTVFADSRVAGFLIAAAQRWAASASLPGRPPLTAAQIQTFARSSPAAAELVRTVSGTWRQYTAAGGADSAQYEILAEALLVQRERQNPSAAPWFLRVARSPYGWGLYRRYDRWYDELGLPVISPSGVFWDRTYAPIAPLPYTIRVEVADPALFNILTYLQQGIASGVLDVTAAAQGYLRNYDLLLPAVVNDWKFLDDLREEIVKMVPLIVWFIGGEVVGRILIAVKSPWVEFLGAAILGAVKATGWVLHISFYGDIALNAIAAGRELLLVRRRPDGTLDQLGRRHLDRAVVLVRRVVVQVATILATKAAAKAGPPALQAAGKDVVRLGRALNRQAKLLFRPELAPAVAGAYGTGPLLNGILMSAEEPPPERGPRTATAERGPRTATAERGPRTPVAPLARPRETVFRPPDWRELEQAVVDFFRRTKPPNGPRYYTSEKHQLSAIYKDFQVFVKKLRADGLPDPLEKADPGVLKLTRRELVKGTELEAECAARTERLTDQLKEAYRRVSAAVDRVSLKEATRERDQVSRELERWQKWLDTNIGRQRLDLFELDPTARTAAATDPSRAWGDWLHNLKSRVYILSLNKLLGWKGGSAIDVGGGKFQSRIFLGPEEGESATPSRKTPATKK